MLHRNVWYKCGLLNLLSSILVRGTHILDRSSVKKWMKIPKFSFRLYTFLKQNASLSYNVREPCKISIRFTVLLLVTCSKLHIVLTFTFILVCFRMFLTLKSFCTPTVHSACSLSLVRITITFSKQPSYNIIICYMLSLRHCFGWTDHQAMHDHVCKQEPNLPADDTNTSSGNGPAQGIQVKYELGRLWHKSGKGKSTCWNRYTARNCYIFRQQGNLLHFSDLLHNLCFIFHEILFIS